MRGTTYLLICGLLLATIPIFTKLLVPFVSPLLIAAIRVGIALVAIFAYLALTGRLDELKIGKNSLKVYIPVGFFGVTIGLGLYLKAIDIIPVANAVFLVYIYPVITAILAWKFLKEEMGKYAVIAIIMTMAGLWVIYGAGSSFILDSWGSLFAIIAGIGYAAFIFSMKYMEGKGYSLWNTIFWPFFFGLIFLIPFALYAEPVKAYFILPVHWYLLGLGLVATFGGYYFYAKGLESMRAHNGPVIVTLTEITGAVVMAAVLLGETAPEYILLGGLAILIGVLFVQLEERERKLKKRV
jgi:drug/metabolite transporter (DMT)-like permease